MKVKLSRSRQKWLQIATSLRLEIQRLARAGETRLPTEAELSERFSVSLMTIRHALASLEAEGLIDRQRRLGTMITLRALKPRQLMMIGKVSDVFVQQQAESTEVLSAEEVDVPPHLAKHFKHHGKVLRLERTRRVDGIRGNYAINHMRLDLAVELDLNLLRSLPVSQVIHEHTSFEIGSIEQDLVAELADPATAERLDIEPLDAVMTINGTTFDRDRCVLDVARLVYRGDMFSFHASVES